MTDRRNYLKVRNRKTPLLSQRVYKIDLKHPREKLVLQKPPEVHQDRGANDCDSRQPNENLESNKISHSISLSQIQLSKLV